MKKIFQSQRRLRAKTKGGLTEIYQEAEDYYFSQMLLSEGNLRRANGLGVLENIEDILEACCR